LHVSRQDDPLRGSVAVEIGVNEAAMRPLLRLGQADATAIHWRGVE
jgi:hypothetical protein